MNEEKFNSGPDKLTALLRESRIAPSLPPRFQENVWRRIEDAEAPTAAPSRLNWLDALVSLVLRPRFALTAAVVLIAAGSISGVREGSETARQNAEIRYVASVAPNSLR